ELVKKNEALTATVDELRQEVARREKAEQTLSQERLILHTLIDNLPDGIYAKDLNGRKIMANPADVRNCSCESASQVIGKTDFDLFPKDLAEHFTADDEAVFKNEPVLFREEYAPDKNGEKHWMLTTKLPLRTEDGKVIDLVRIGQDVTPLKEAE